MRVIRRTALVAALVAVLAPASEIGSAYALRPGVFPSPPAAAAVKVDTNGILSQIGNGLKSSAEKGNTTASQAGMILSALQRAITSGSPPDLAAVMADANMSVEDLEKVQALLEAESQELAATSAQPNSAYAQASREVARDLAEIDALIQAKIAAAKQNPSPSPSPSTPSSPSPSPSPPSVSPPPQIPTPEATAFGACVSYGQVILIVAKQHNLDPYLLAAIGAQESGGPWADSGDATAYNPAGAWGWGQIANAKWAATHNWSDPYVNISEAAAIFSGFLVATGGNVMQALHDYNAGSASTPSETAFWKAGPGLPTPITVPYEVSVMMHYKLLKDGVANLTVTGGLCSPSSGQTSGQGLGR